jgi:hypothetical protein
MTSIKIFGQSQKHTNEDKAERVTYSVNGQCSKGCWHRVESYSITIICSTVMIYKTKLRGLSLRANYTD